MQVRIESPKLTWHPGERVEIRILALNDTYSPFWLDHRCLIGPNLVPSSSNMMPFPLSVDPPFPAESQNVTWLNPWCFYGRTRVYDFLPPGEIIVYAYVLNRLSQRLLWDRPVDADALLANAPPITLTMNPHNPDAQLSAK